MDRNPAGQRVQRNFAESLSARRAWIEIRAAPSVSVLPRVALRKESVDRNSKSVAGQRALMVALRKESVDRNRTYGDVVQGIDGRSPQGERG